MSKPIINKRGYRAPSSDRAGIKESDNLFMDGFNWREFNRRCDEFMRRCGIPKEKTPTFIQ